MPLPAAGVAEFPLEEASKKRAIIGDSSMRLLLLIFLVATFSSQADEYNSGGYEFISGTEADSDGNTNLVKISYMNHIANPLFIGGDIAFNIEQWVLDDVNSQRFEHEVYGNFNVGLLFTLDESFMAYAFVGANVGRFERDLSVEESDAVTSEDTTETGHVFGLGFGIGMGRGQFATFTVSHIDNGEGFVFTGINLNLTSKASYRSAYR